MLDLPISAPVLLAQIWNFLILAALVVAAFLVGRDAREKGLSWLESITWGALTLFIFPIGLGLYLLLRRRNSQKHMTV